MPHWSPREDAPEHRLVVSRRLRLPGRLDQRWNPEAPEPSIAELVALAQAAGPEHALWLGGGEPSLRSDLPALLRACHDLAPGRVGLITDGLALRTAAGIAPLVDAGLGAVRICLYSSRPEAHDWLVDQRGAAKGALRAIQRCAQAGLRVEVEAALTRPTAPQLPELWVLCRRLGVRRLNLRRLQASGPAAEDYIALAARFALLEPLLVELAAETERSDVLTLSLEDLPRCAAGAAASHLRDSRMISWSEPPLARFEPDAACPTCPGNPRCPGAPAAYIALFGATELQSEDGRAAASVPAEPPEILAPPPPRFGRAPATRHHVVIAQVDAPLGGDPLAPRAPRMRRTQIDFRIDPETPSRRIRQALVQLAQEGAETLHITGLQVLSHPDAPSLLRECTRLGFSRVELTSDLQPLETLGDADLYGLRGLSLAVAVIDSADAFTALQPQLERLARLSGAQTAVAARLSDPADLPPFEAAWAAGQLPEPVRFVLSAPGGEAAALLAARSSLGDAIAVALDAALPACWRVTPSEGPGPCGTLGVCRRQSDLRPHCPGIPPGWSPP